MHQSVCTIDSPQFINLQSNEINPLMSECEIKVFYLGENRNKSFINKQVATEMAKTLRGAPIVGYYKDSKEDFADHGEKVIIDDEGVHFSCETRPYGFVAPDAKVWFQTFEENDGFGETITREYLMTTGYLWTGQFEECKSVFEGEGKPQSMELDPSSLEGNWATNSKGMEFFIINDAIFSKLCILGEDVEPCFEGAKVSNKEISNSFSLDDGFRKTLYSMMQDLNFALKGGTQMEEKTISTNEQVNFEQIESVEIEEKAETVVESDFVASKEDKKEENKEDKKEQSEDKEESKDGEKSDEEDKKKKEYKCSDDDEKKKNYKADEEDKKDEEEEDDKKKPATKSELIEETANEFELKYTQLREEFDNLKNMFSALEEQNKELTNFKNQIEDAQKDELINSFYMLDDADKANVIENKSKYTYDEIKKELSVICFDKKVSFSCEKDAPEKQLETTVTFNVTETASLPDWIKAVKENQSVIY